VETNKMGEEAEVSNKVGGGKKNRKKRGSRTSERDRGNRGSTGGKEG
jgi:hypothetical protein